MEVWFFADTQISIPFKLETNVKYTCCAWAGGMYDIPFLSLYLSHSYARAPVRLNRLLHFIKSFLPIPNLLGVHQKVNFGPSSWQN